MGLGRQLVSGQRVLEPQLDVFLGPGGDVLLADPGDAQPLRQRLLLGREPPGRHQNMWIGFAQEVRRDGRRNREFETSGQSFGIGKGKT